MFRSVLLVLWIALLSGCSSLATYEVNEADLEGYLQKAVKRLDEQQAQQGSPLSVSLQEVHINVGPDNRDVVVLDAKGQAELNALVTKIPVDVALKIEGAPVYSGKDKAVYIRRLHLINSDIKSPYVKGDIKPVTDMLMNLLTNMLETMPVYRLDESDPKQRMLANMPVDIVVGSGVLKIVPQKD
ncbi:MAG TPA: DUF1439 domain-containing protein [Pseudomonadales bacterium]|nr:DUF1439 domain-containing protein [Pseudomonadales bacterium]